MAKPTKIGWTCFTWNIAVGCTKISPGCKYCYMYRDMERYGKDGNVIERTKAAFYKPDKIKEPSLIFACSWTDFFHEELDSFRMEAWDIIRRNPHHIFQILTKRSERIASNLPPYWSELKNVWLGVSVESPDYCYRITDLCNVRSNHHIKRFISYEPLIEPMPLIPMDNAESNGYYPIDWVIIGGESGNKTGKYQYRDCNISWIGSIMTYYKSKGAAVFIKQLGTALSQKLCLKSRSGDEPSEWPEHLRVQEFPVDLKQLGIKIKKE